MLGFLEILPLIFFLGAIFMYVKSKYSITEERIKNKESYNFIKLVDKAYKKAKMLQKLRFIQNELLSNSAYHIKNIEEQFKKLDNVKIPKYEKNVISRFWDLKFKLSQALLSSMDEVLDYAEKNYNDTKK